MRNKRKKSSRKMLRTAHKRARLCEQCEQRITERVMKELEKRMLTALSQVEFLK